MYGGLSYISFKQIDKWEIVHDAGTIFPVYGKRVQEIRGCGVIYMVKGSHGWEFLKKYTRVHNHAQKCEKDLHKLLICRVW